MFEKITPEQAGITSKNVIKFIKALEKRGVILGFKSDFYFDFIFVFFFMDSQYLYPWASIALWVTAII